MKAWIAVVVLMSVPALAQTEKKPEKSVQRVDLTGTTIDGNRLIGGGDFIVPKPKSVFPNMIRVRGNFEPELQKSVDSL